MCPVKSRMHSLRWAGSERAASTLDLVAADAPDLLLLVGAGSAGRAWARAAAGMLVSAEGVGHGGLGSGAHSRAGVSISTDSGTPSRSGSRADFRASEAVSADSGSRSCLSSGADPRARVGIGAASVGQRSSGSGAGPGGAVRAVLDGREEESRGAGRRALRIRVVHVCTDACAASALQASGEGMPCLLTCWCRPACIPAFVELVTGLAVLVPLSTKGWLPWRLSLSL